MQGKSRLDRIVKLQERTEDERRTAMADAGRNVTAAEEALARARRLMLQDCRGRAAASEWMLEEVAHGRALQEAFGAERGLVAARKQELEARQRYFEAHARAEGIRRLASSRAEEMLRAQTRAETRELDEIATLAFGRARR